MPATRKTKDKETLGVTGTRSLNSRAMLLLLFLSLAAWVLSLQFFEFGFWSRAEPLIVWHHFVCAGIAAILFSIWLKNPETTQSIFSHPLVYLPALLGLWSLLISAGAEFPMLSVLGAPQSGQGALWFFELSLLTATFLHCVKDVKAWRILTIVALTSSFLLALCVATWKITGSLSLLPVPDFYAYLSLALPFIAIRNTDSLFDKRLYFASWPIAFSLIGATTNLTAGMLLAVAAGALFIYGRLQKSSKLKKWGTHRGVAATIVLLAITLPYIIVTQIPFVSAVRSLKSRQLLWDLMEDAQSSDLATLILGHGWGHTDNAFVRHLNATTANTWTKEWDFIWRDFFHSHNAIVEALYTAGLPAVLLTIGFLVAIPLCASSERRFAATLFAAIYGAMNAVWIELTVCVPFYAAAVAVFAGTGSSKQKSSPFGSFVVPVLLVGLAIGLTVSATALFRYGIAVTKAQQLYHKPGERTSPVIFPKDFRGQDLAFGLVLRTTFDGFNQQGVAPDGLFDKQKSHVVGWILADLKERIPKSNSPRLALAGVAIYSELFYLKEMMSIRPDIEESLPVWESWIKHLLALAPRRSDMSLPFMAKLLELRQLDRLISLCREILRRDNNDPSGLYYTGAVLTLRDAHDAKAAGLAFINAALQAGISRIIPIPEWLKKRAAQFEPPRNIHRTLEIYFDK